MAGPSYSEWFLRFVTAFDGPGREPDTAGVSHQEWLEAFIETFRGEREGIIEVDEGHATRWAAFDFDAGEEESDSTSQSHAEPYRAREPKRGKYMQSGGEDVEQ